MRIKRFEAISAQCCKSVFWHQSTLTFLISTSRPRALIITLLPFPAFCVFWLLQDPMRPPRPCFHNSTTTFAQTRLGTKRAALKRQLLQSLTLMNGRHRKLSSESTSSLNHRAWKIQAWLTAPSHKTPVISLGQKLPPKNGCKWSNTKLITFHRGRRGRFHSYAWTRSRSPCPFYGSRKALSWNIMFSTTVINTIFLGHKNQRLSFLKTGP